MDFFSSKKAMTSLKMNKHGMFLEGMAVFRVKNRMLVVFAG